MPSKHKSRQKRRNINIPCGTQTNRIERCKAAIYDRKVNASSTRSEQCQIIATGAWKHSCYTHHNRSKKSSVAKQAKKYKQVQNKSAQKPGSRHLPHFNNGRKAIIQWNGKRMRKHKCKFIPEIAWLILKIQKNDLKYTELYNVYLYQ